jgi:hypothetical protein
MFSKRELEGYLEVNHRNSPGITPEQAAATGFVCMPVGAGQTLKAPTYNCCGCQALIIVNPMRREWCSQCDRYLCDRCALARKLTGFHKPYKKFLDEIIERSLKGKPWLAESSPSPP